jgi:hypothetical protein
MAGHIPPGGGCDRTTLAVEAAVNRTGFYPEGNRPGPYQHLAEEFNRRLKLCKTTDRTPILGTHRSPGPRPGTPRSTLGSPPRRPKSRS